MKYSTSLVLAIALIAAPAFAMDDMAMSGQGMDIKAMDTNHDGMISKAEFMKYHTNMWMKMKKNKAGMVDMSDMAAMHDSNMHGTMTTPSTTPMATPMTTPMTTPKK